MKISLKFTGFVALSIIGIYIYFCTPLNKFLSKIAQNKSTSFSIMSFEQYEPIEHDVPYTFKLIKPNQCLFYFGSNHSHDSSNEQYEKLKQLWAEFLEQTKGKNCVVLIEGGTRPPCKTEIEAITDDGEAGFIFFLAQQQNIVCLSPEPDDKYLEKQLLKQFNPDEVYYMRFADIWHQFNELRKNDPILDLAKYLQKFDNFLGGLNLDQFKKIHEQLFHTKFNIYDDHFLTKIIDPTKITVITPVHQKNNILRDEYIVSQIQDLIKKGKNVFVVFGAAHAVMQEPAIKALWNQNTNETRPLALINLGDHPWIMQTQQEIKPLIDHIIKDEILHTNPKVTQFPEFYLKQRHLITLLYSKQVPVDMEQAVINAFKQFPTTAYPRISQLNFSDHFEFFGKDRSELVVKINDPKQYLPKLRQFIIDNLPAQLHANLATKEHNKFKFAPHETLGKIPVDEIEKISNQETVEKIKKRVVVEVQRVLQKLSASNDINSTELFVYGNDFKAIFKQTLMCELKK